MSRFGRAALLATITFFARAASAGPSFTYEGVLEKSDGQGGFIAESGPKSFVVEINGVTGSTNSPTSCILYSETQNVTLVDGHFSFKVGTGTGATVAASESFAKLFEPRANIAGPASCTFNAQDATARRTMRIRDASDMTSLGELELTSAPRAMVADSLRGYSDTDFLKINSSTSLSQANVEALFSTTNYASLSSLLSGSSNLYVSTQGTSGFTTPTYANAPSSLVAGSLWYDSVTNTMKYFNGSSTVALGSTGDSFSQYALLAGRSSGQTLSGGNSASGTLTLDSTSNSTKGSIVLAPNGGGVGIGTTTPYENFEIYGVGGTSSIHVTNIDNFNNAAFIGRKASYSAGAAAAATTGDLATFGGLGHTGSGFPNTSSGGMVIRAAGTFSASSFPTSLALFTTSGTSRVDRLFIDPNGKVGIGTTVPAALLDVNGVIRAQQICAGDGTNCRPLSTAWPTGTVSSVAVSAPSIFTVANSPVTGSGTIAIDLATQTTNKVFAAPNGSTGQPTFRALVAADLPTISLTAGVAGVLPLANGGTGLSTLGNAVVVATNGAGTVTPVAGSTAGTILQYTVSGPAYSSASYPSSTTANQLLYSSSSNVIAGLTSASNAVLTTNASGVPSWNAISADPLSSYVFKNGRSGGQSFAGGTGAGDGLAIDSTVDSSKGVIALNPSGGAVGVGTNAPRSTLDVAGTMTSAPSSANASSTSAVDFLKGNIQHATYSCTSGIKLYNLRDGGSYTFIVKGSTSGTCGFLAYSDSGTTVLTLHMPPGHTASTASTHTIYSFLVSGTDVYVNWAPGY